MPIPSSGEISFLDFYRPYLPPMGFTDSLASANNELWDYSVCQTSDAFTTRQYSGALSASSTVLSFTGNSYGRGVEYKLDNCFPPFRLTVYYYHNNSCADGGITFWNSTRSSPNWSWGSTSYYWRCQMNCPTPWNMHHGSTNSGSSSGVTGSVFKWTNEITTSTARWKLEKVNQSTGSLSSHYDYTFSSNLWATGIIKFWIQADQDSTYYRTDFWNMHVEPF